MMINKFIEDFFGAFDEIEIEELAPEIEFRNIDEWSSLHGLATLIMIENTCQVKISADELRTVNTIQELFNMVEERKNGQL